MTILIKDGIVVSANELDTYDHLADGVNRILVNELPAFSSSHDITYPNGEYVYIPKATVVPTLNIEQELALLKQQLALQKGAIDYIIMNY